MQTYLVCLVTVLLAGCSIRLQLDLQRDRPTPAPPVAAAPPAAQAVPSLLREYRAALGEGCAQGWISREQCRAHEETLLQLLQGDIAHQQRMAEQLEMHAEAVENPQHGTVLRGLARVLKRMLVR